MNPSTRARAATAIILAGTLTFALTSCTPADVPTTWDKSNATVAVGKANQSLQLWLQFGSPQTTTFLRTNSKQLSSWQDSGSLQVVYHPLTIPGGSSADREYNRIAGSVLAALAESQPKKVTDAIAVLGDIKVTDGQTPTEDAIQSDLKKAGISVDVAKATRKYGDAIETATAKNRQTGPIRAEPTAILNGTFINTGPTFVTDVTAALERSTGTPVKQ